MFCLCALLGKAETSNTFLLHMQTAIVFHVKLLFEGVHCDLPLKHSEFQTQAQKNGFLVTLLQLLWSLSMVFVYHEQGCVV